MERIRFGDGQFLTVPGHGGRVEEHDGVIYLAIALRNGGDGLAVLHGWRARRRDAGDPERRRGPGRRSAPDCREFRQQLIDLYIPSGDNGYWLGALRDRNQPGYEEVSSAPGRRRPDRQSICSSATTRGGSGRSCASCSPTGPWMTMRRDARGRAAQHGSALLERRPEDPR